MPIRPYAFQGGVGVPDVDYYPAGNGFAYKVGDVLGLMSGTSAQTDGSPAGTLRRLGAIVGGAAASFPIVLASGIIGIVGDDLTASAAGISTTPAAPTGVNPMVPAKLALPSRSDALSGSNAIAGVQRSQTKVWLATDQNYFIQRHKKATRVNQTLVGALCALTYNAVTLEFEVDSTAGSPSVVIVDMAPTYGDNRTYYDSATFATDLFGAWVVFKFIPSVQASPLGLRYAT